MPSTKDRARIARINRRLAKDGQMLSKVREDSRWFAQYGPFMIVDSNNTVVASSIDDLDALEQELSGRHARERTNA